MRSVSWMAACVVAMGMAGCERETNPTPGSRATAPGAIPAPNEKVVLTPEQQEEVARAKLLLTLLSKGSPVEK